MGRFASVLNASNYNKLLVQRVANEMVDAESDAFTFAIECYYFGEDNDAANASKAKLLQNWKEHATAIGVQLRESPVNANIDDTSLLSKHPGHVTFGSCYIGVIPFGSFRHFDIFSVSKIITVCIA